MTLDCTKVETLQYSQYCNIMSRLDTFKQIITYSRHTIHNRHQQQMKWQFFVCSNKALALFALYYLIRDEIRVDNVTKNR